MGGIARFWQTLSRQTTPIGDRFRNTSQLMVYLKRCAFTVVLDQQEAVQKERQLHKRMSLAERETVSHYGGTILQQLIDDAEHEDLRKWIERYVTDSAENLILTLTFEQGLTPRDIVANHADTFPDIRSVRRTRERLLKRARRYW